MEEISCDEWKNIALADHAITEELQHENERAAEVIRALREALRVYADENCWGTHSCEFTLRPLMFWKSKNAPWQLARHALATTERS